jgi:hypothetical protein
MRVKAFLNIGSNQVWEPMFVKRCNLNLSKFGNGFTVWFGALQATYLPMVLGTASFLVVIRPFSWKKYIEIAVRRLH